VVGSSRGSLPVSRRLNCESHAGYGRAASLVCYSFKRSKSQYDTILDAILTCARKLTRVSLIYHTEPTTKRCKTEKLKSKKRICSEVTVNSLRNPCNQSGRRKGRLRCGGTSLCSYLVRGVDGSCAKHLTVKSYTIIYAANSYTYYY